MRKTCLNSVYKLACQDDRVVFIGSDLGAGTLSEFKQNMPERFFMEGISEANIIGMAAGLALEGKIVYVNTIASFLVRRAFEQLVLDLCLHNLKVRFIGNGGGFVYAPLGPTHQITEDLASLRAVPNLSILVPADAREMQHLMALTLDYPGPVYIRLAKGYDPIVTPDIHYNIGDLVTIREGKQGIIFTTGICLQYALEAVEQLSDVAIIHVPTIKPLDVAAIKQRIANIPVVCTIEEHSIVGGLGSAIAEIIAESGQGKKFKRIGVNDQFADHYGSQKELLKRFDISSEAIVTFIKQSIDQ